MRYFNYNEDLEFILTEEMEATFESSIHQVVDDVCRYSIYKSKFIK